MIRISRNDFVSGEEYGDSQVVYGFVAYDDSGRSMPKGSVTSYNATAYKRNAVTRRVVVEFSIQSPTGDSSDFHNYSFPCLDMTQAVAIVDAARASLEAQLGLSSVPTS